MTAQPYTLRGPLNRPAGKYVLRPLDSKEGWKGRASYLAENLGGRWSHQAGGYVLSPGAARDFGALYAAGFTGGPRTIRRPPTFIHCGSDLREMTRREALARAKADQLARIMDEQREQLFATGNGGGL